MQTLHDSTKIINAHFDYDTPLINFRDSFGSTPYTIKASLEGILCLGNTGSGKTSGPGKMIRKRFLENGYGGIVLTVKDSESKHWLKDIEAADRLNDVIHVTPGGAHKFSFLGYESKTSARGNAITGNLLDTLKVVIRASENQNPNDKGSDPFWSDSLDTALTNTINLCLLAYEFVSIQDLHDIFNGAPKTVTNPKGEATLHIGKEFREAYSKAELKNEMETARFIDSLSIADKEKIKDAAVYERLVIANVPTARTFKFIHNFFLDTYRNLAGKTRSIVDMAFTGFLFRLLQDPINPLFCGVTSTFTPEDCFNGKIILLDIPLKVYDRVAQDAQLLVKYIFQKAFEKRDTDKNNRPLFIYCDEGHLLLHERDQMFQTTCREKGISVVTISQNLANFYAGMGGGQSKSRVDSLINTFGTRFFCCNGDDASNEFASKLIGSAYFEKTSSSKTMGSDYSSSRSKEHVLEPIMRPEFFSFLKCGGREHNYIVEAMMHVQGRPFHNGLLHRKVAFKQTS